MIPTIATQSSAEMVDEALPQPAEQQAAIDPPQRILVVDDDMDQLAALLYRLQKLGYETATASSGRQAIESATSTVPDLVLLDLCLPDADGFDVCEQLGDSAATSCVPVIILSGMESDDIVRRARNAGCIYYLRKPYDPNVLLALIQNALDSARELGW